MTLPDFPNIHPIKAEEGTQLVQKYVGYVFQMACHPHVTNQARSELISSCLKCKLPNITPNLDLSPYLVQHAHPHLSDIRYQQQNAIHLTEL